MGMQKWGIAAGGRVSAGLALSVSIAAAAEVKSLDLKDDRVEISAQRAHQLAFSFSRQVKQNTPT
jgi:hypothetical protein